VAECAPYYPPVAALPSAISGVPVSYVPWKRIAELAVRTAGASPSHAEKRLLLELHSYLKGLMTMRNVTSNLVYVVALGQDAQDWSSITFKETVVERNYYYHPVGGKRGGWPRTSPNYVGFRFDGRLQQIRHMEHYESSPDRTTTSRRRSQRPIGPRNPISSTRSAPSLSRLRRCAPETSSATSASGARWISC
jgi:hypothetical protein